MSLALISKSNETAAAKKAAPRARADEPVEPFERESDRTAEERAVEGRPASWSLAGKGIGAPPENPRDNPLNNPGRGPNKVPALVRDALSSPGQPLEPATRGTFEKRFGYDFGKVRVHADSPAAMLARQLGAAAVTAGPQIMFREGAYAPGTNRGERLIAHELVHVMQHEASGGQVRSRLSSDPADAAEEQADAVGRRMAAGRSLGAWSPVAPSSLLSLATETWFRGEAAGVAAAPDSSATARGPVHDLGEGTYFTDRLDVAESYANLRADASETAGRVISGELDPGTLGKTLDLTKEPEFMSAYNHTSETIKVSGEPYRNLVEGHLKSKGLHVDDFDVLIGPEGVRGGRQMRIRDPGIAARVRAGMTVVKPGGAPGGGSGSGGPPRGGSASGDPAPSPRAAPEAAKPPAEGVVEGPVKGAPDVVAPKPPTVGEVEVPGGVGDVAAGTGAAEAAAGGLAAEIGGIVLAFAVEAVIAIAISLVLEWVKGFVEEIYIERDMRALDPKMEAELQKLAPKITELQKHGKVFSRVTIDIRRRQGSKFEQNAPVVWDYYDGITLVGFDVEGESRANTRREWQQRLSKDEDLTHYEQSLTTLIDDPQKRAREKQSAALKEKLLREAQKKPAPPPSQTPPPPITRELTPPGIAQAPQTYNFLPFAPGASQGPDVDAVVAAIRAGAVRLLAPGEKLAAGQATKTDIEAFKAAEDTWRSWATIWFNHFKDNGPDYARGKVDDILHLPQLGGRLASIRQQLGG
jgi:hypothetical protein